MKSKHIWCCLVLHITDLPYYRCFSKPGKWLRKWEHMNSWFLKKQYAVIHVKYCNLLLTCYSSEDPEFKYWLSILFKRVGFAPQTFQEYAGHGHTCPCSHCWRELANTKILWYSNFFFRAVLCCISKPLSEGIQENNIWSNLCWTTCCKLS